MKLENMILSEVTHSQKNSHCSLACSMALIDKWTLIPKLGIAKIQFTEHMKLKKKEDHNVDASILLKRGNKILIGRGNL